jgi:hypothetical protein
LIVVGLMRALDQLQLINRASHAHVYHSATDTGFKRTLRIPRLISADDLNRVQAYEAEAEMVTVFMDVFWAVQSVEPDLGTD